MKNFVKFMVSMAGRILRIIAGLAIIALGIFVFPTLNWLFIIIGLIPLLAGIFDFCILAPLMGYFFSGKKTREKVNS
jgi:hypothetical protein